MKLLKVSNFKRNSSLKRGFTLIELFTVIAGIGILSALFIPIGLRYYQNVAVNETVLVTLNSLKYAQSKALFSQNDTSSGIKFQEYNYIIFSGESFEEREEIHDKRVYLPTGISVGMTEGEEIIFEKGTGETEEDLFVFVNLNNDERIIEITSKGKVELLLD